MKNSRLKAIIVMVTFFFTFNSCQQNNCQTSGCLNGGNCLNGICNCPTGYTGPDCGTELTPSSMSITRVDVTSFPLLSPVGGLWDASSVADPFVTLSPGTTVYVFHDITGMKINPPSGTLTYNLSTPETITDLSSQWTLSLFDYDDYPDPSDFIGGTVFYPQDHYSGFSDFFIVSGMGVTFKVYITWNF